MTVKTEQLLFELTDALFEKKAVLLTGNTGVGKTYLARKVAEQLRSKEYSCFPLSKEQSVITEIISCHNSVTYEDIVGGITAETDSGNILFEYKDKILIETLVKASNDYNTSKGTKYVIILDDLQRNNISSLFGDAIDVIGLEGEEKIIHLNSGAIVDITPNFYIIGTYNSSESGAIPISSGILRKFYVREILSDIAYLTDDPKSKNATYYDRVRSLIINHLDMQYRLSTYEQNRYLIGHGYFNSENIEVKIKHQLIPILKQYVTEGILDRDAEELIRLLEVECEKKNKIMLNTQKKCSFTNYKTGVLKKRFIDEESTKRSSIPIENLVGRIIDQKLLSDDRIKSAILFNKKVCYREVENDGITYLATLVADKLRHDNIRRGKKSDGRCLYNGGRISIDGNDYYFTGGSHPKDFVKDSCWNNKCGYKLGESFGGNLLPYRIVWQYYQALIDEYTQYLEYNPKDTDKKKLLEYIVSEWEAFLDDFKKIKPKAVDKKGRADKEWKRDEAIYNEEANKEVRKRIAELTILWRNPGDSIIVADGSKVILEGVENKMSNTIYKEYKDAMEMLDIKQMILQGPPGTSKTYSAKEFIKFLANNCTDEDFKNMQISDYSQVDKYCKMISNNDTIPEVAWDIIQFHPSYGYEDFVRGIKVSTRSDTDSIVYETVNKVLGNIAELAKKHPMTKFFLIIDEINRANLATVFGELIYGLEYRNEFVATPYAVNGDNKINLPENLYIIGTMNTADKSIGGIDYAIRRRFLFFEQLPDKGVIENYKKNVGASQMLINEKACKLFDNVAKIFTKDYLSPEYRKEDVQIGHTYFLVDSEEKLLKRFEYQIIPILKEYYKDGMITFDVDDTKDGKQGFKGLLECIAGKINISSQKDDIEKIFKDLIS